ncbi:MAG: response regulator [Treponema sp.]|jgi:putative two-component system response regulator|nr:response regulator [Treponema sp.]
MENQKKLIFLVDDNPANLRIGKNVLSEKYTVATAPSAAKLFKLLESNHPVLILLDVDMPDLDGYKTIEILKSKSETKDIPVIFLTGMADSQTEEKGRTLGAVDYMTKPFDPPKLFACLNKYI